MPRNRQGPGLLRSVARTTAKTAAISATATATSRAVNNAIDQKATRAQQEQVAVMQTQHDIEQMKAQLAAVQSPPTPAVPAAQTDLLAQLTQLAQLKEAGALTDAEFQLAKAKLLS